MNETYEGLGPFKEGLAKFKVHEDGVA